MRILSIRGKNLASLYGEFEVRLDRSPIADAGLFCISGPTGAGKSTLLDALCLALYGKTPRTRDRGGVLVGREDQPEKERIAANDPRAILSRGTGDGYAEVEFEGTGGSFVATWSVHRAGKKPGGRLQDAKMVLRELGSERVLGEGLADVQREIEKRVGFSFDEFCRAVLLPQFEFTNFLRARADDRAAILERVTGKEIYTQVSIKAHQRAGDNRRKLEALGQQIEATPVLDAVTRKELEDEVARREAEVAGIAARLEEARKAVEWHRREAALAADLAKAEQDLAAARERETAAAPRREELRDAEAAEPLRPLRDEAVRTAERWRQARLEVDRLAEAAKARAEEAARLAAALVVAEAGATRARADLEAARPEIEAAKDLDRAIAAAREAAEKAEAEVARSAANVERSRSEVRAHGAKETEARRAKAEAESWLGAHRDRLALADGWSRWEAELGRHGKAVAALAAGEKALADARQAHDGVLAARKKAADDERLLGERAATLGREAETAEAAAAAIARGELASRRDLLAGRISGYGELARLSALVVSSSGAMAAARTLADEVDAFLKSSAEDLDRVAAERARSEGRLAEAREDLDRLCRSLDYDDARALLRDGEPCPLCGSVDHPWAHGAPVARIEEKKARVAELEGTYRRLGDEQHDLETRRAAARERANHAAADGERARVEWERARGAYDQLSREHGVAVGAEEAGPELARLAAETEAALVALRAEEQEADRLVEEARRLRKQADVARQAHEKSRSTCFDLERQLEAAAHRVASLEAECGRCAGDRDAAEAQLATVLAFRPGWQDEARRDAAGFLSACRRWVDEILARREEVVRAERAIATATTDLEAARARLAERQETFAAAVATRDEAVALRKQRLEERGKFLGGRPTAEVEASLRRAIDAADEAVKEARRVATAGENRAAVARSSHGEAVQRAEVAARDAGAAEERLAAALAAAGLDRATLDRRLAHEPGWIARVRRELSALEEAVRVAEILGNERRRNLDDHRAEGRPSLDLQAALAVREQGADELARAESLRDDGRVRLRSDDEARDRRAQMEEERNALEKAAGRWISLAKLIGSSDGKSFRLFAQGLAFDLLLEGANVHLRELARRYRLARVPGTDLDLQVIDQDLGDEVRPVNGLSGGESFLVSLALALGLASLSTKADHAKTLFIDEGFGTLDRDTLDHAMVALEGLQSAGRTVGVISHVPEMHERVGVRVDVEHVAVGKSRVVVRGP